GAGEGDEAEARAGDDAEGALGADEEVEEVRRREVAGGRLHVRLLPEGDGPGGRRRTVRGHDAAIGKHGLDGLDPGTRRPIPERARARRVAGDGTTERAFAARGGIRGE